jgi:hypothetical protein
VLVLVCISQIRIADQKFGTNRLHLLFPNSIHKKSVHKTVYSNHIVYIMYILQLTFVFINGFFFKLE